MISTIVERASKDMILLLRAQSYSKRQIFFDKSQVDYY